MFVRADPPEKQAYGDQDHCASLWLKINLDAPINTSLGVMETYAWDTRPADDGRSSHEAVKIGPDLYFRFDREEGEVVVGEEGLYALVERIQPYLAAMAEGNQYERATERTNLDERGKIALDFIRHIIGKDEWVSPVPESEHGGPS